MAQRIRPEDIDPEILQGKTIAILGYGNQGRAHALNLQDSGFEVVVGSREGKGAETARADGFTVLSISEAVSAADVLMLSLPDGPMSAIYADSISPNLRARQTVLFAHGFNVVFDQIKVPANIDVAMVSPKGAGYGVRAAFENGSGVPALVAVHQDASGEARGTALAYAWGLGCARSLILETSFREETVTDLFGEQTVLCGGIPSLVRSAFDTLVDAGYSPEVAYFECLHETKLIVDLMIAKGIAGMRESISDTAAWGGLQVGPRMVDEHLQTTLRSVLTEIEDGRFAARWMAEQRDDLRTFKELRLAEAEENVESVGRTIRKEIGLE